MARAYDHLTRTFDKLGSLKNAHAILEMDMYTHMPPGSEQDRVNQMTTLSALSHEILADPKIEDWLDAAEQDSAILSTEEQANLREMRYRWVHTASLPADLEKTRSRLETEGALLHDKVKRSGDCSEALPHLRHAIETMQKIGNIKKDALALPTAYDALIN